LRQLRQRLHEAGCGICLRSRPRLRVLLGRSVQRASCDLEVQERGVPLLQYELQPRRVVRVEQLGLERRMPLQRRSIVQQRADVLPDACSVQGSGYGSLELRSVRPRLSGRVPVRWRQLRVQRQRVVQCRERRDVQQQALYVWGSAMQGGRALSF
jgi:hypothetical protein